MSSETSKYSENPFDDFSSKIKRLYIPLPNYEYFHKPTTVGDVDRHFVGRGRILRTLEGWLKEPSKKSKANYSGSYLITGYRGMGKSSVVGKAIHDIIYGSKKDKGGNYHKIWMDKVRPILDILALLSIFCISFFLIERATWKDNYVWIMIFAVPLLYLVFRILFDTRWFKKIVAMILWSKMFKEICVIFNNRKDKENKKNAIKRRYTHYVYLNVGDEISDERYILAMIANSIRVKFEEYIHEVYPSSGISLLRKASSLFVINGFIYVLFEWLSKSSNWLLQIIRNHNDIVLWWCCFAISVGLYFLLVQIGKYLIKLSGFGYRFVSTRTVLEKLNNLCDRIDATVGEATEIGGTIKAKYHDLGGSISMQKQRNKQYPYALVREIEQELIQIIGIFDKSWLVQSRLIIVLDELDKLVIESNKGNEKKPDLPEFAYKDSGFPGSSSYRVKKQNLLYLLAQLKFFISNANAKFIFIAGRELFDAYKEDVSDREFSISSIFNGILNVDSFFTYNSGTKDITRMTERYLCRQLFVDDDEMERESTKHRDLNLHKYYISSIANESENEKIKIFVFLRHFVTYLTYVSNGAPKKITNQFERFVITKDQRDEDIKKTDNEREYVDVKVRECEEPEYYLSFGYYDQQKINFIHYMVDPVFRSIISPASEYGDKLLVSSSFLLGHIFKHHNGGFSMQNLEYLPELIENTRTPELREFVNSIMSFLKQIQIVNIPTGLYEYKFHMKLYEEISVFSKRSEIISAIFNFSRDYSLSVKQYFSDLLDYYSKSKDCTPIVKANIHHYLGDLYMSSEEYSEAINHFRITKDLIIKEFNLQKNSKESGTNATLIARLTRVMLKMGLAYEKRNTIDSAYLTYNELVNILISNRLIDEGELGLDYKLEKTPLWEENRILLFPRDNDEISKKPLLHDLFKKIRPSFVVPRDNEAIWWAYNDELIPKLTYPLSEQVSAVISKISIYEDLRIAYTPLLAKLFSIEKQNIGGITLTNIAVMESEFRHLFLLTNNKEKYILSADFFRKLGDILYYKNSDFKRRHNNLCKLLDLWDYNLEKDISDYCFHNEIPKNIAENIIDGVKKISIDEEDVKKVKKELETYNSAFKWYCRKLFAIWDGNSSERRKEISDFLHSDFNRLPNHYAFAKINTITECFDRQGKSCFACKYYNRSLFILAHNIIPEQLEYCKTLSKGLWFLAVAKLKNPKTNQKYDFREKELSQIALTLEAMGHVLLSCHKEEDLLGNDFLTVLMALYKEDKGDKKQNGIHINSWLDLTFNGVKKNKELLLNTLEKSLVYYFAAAEYYGRLGNTKQEAQCYTKIFTIIYMSISPLKKRQIRKTDSNLRRFIKWLETNRLSFAVRSIQSSQDYINLLEFENYIPMDVASNMPDMEEAVIAFCKIKIALEYKGIPMDNGELQRLYNNLSLTHNRLDSLIYNRIISLLFKEQMNKLMLRRFFNALKIDGTVFNDKFRDNYHDLLDAIHIRNGDPRIQIVFEGLKHILGKEGSIHDLLSFLITDSIFCLTSIVEYLAPTFRTTLFTNNLCGDVYKNLLEWVKIKEVYKCYNSTINYYLKRKVKGKQYELTSSKTYLREMALKYYSKSLEMNSEGQAYQDYIAGMTIVDDDLQNDICQFHLAIERYRIRNGDIRRKMNLIMKYAKDKEESMTTESRCYSLPRYWEGKI